MNFGAGEEPSSEALFLVRPPSSSTPPPATPPLFLDRPAFLPKKVLRVPALKRNRDTVPLSERVKLERVLGLTVSGSAALCCDTHSGSIVYPAGCVVVLYNLRKNRQTHLLNASKKTITSLDVSTDGKYVVTGECGHLPNVRIWDIQEKVQVAEFTGHKFGINCVAFSPNLKYVVSVGSQHDMIVNVWEWRSGVKVASNKVSSKVKAVAFSEGGNYFVTVGNRHVKFWYLECSARPSKYKEPVPLMGRSAILGEQRNNYFCDVACGRGDIAASTFSITKSGLLCEFNSRRLLDKWVELRTASANCLCVGRNFIFIGCSDGIVRCFNPYTIEYITTLPRTHCLGVDVSKGLNISHMAVQKPDARFPDTVAIALDEAARKVTCVYADHSVYVWDVTDIKKVGKSHSFLYHSACIWGVEVYPSDKACASRAAAALPLGSFVTCSSDDTIRVWNLEANMSTNTFYRRNIYSNELLKIVYVDESLNYLCDLDRNPGGSNDKMDATYDTKNGVRCIRVSPDGQQLASGDRSGNIRIHELHRMDEVCKIEAHDSEVLNLEYSKPDTGHRLLASASRDRLIHVFDVDQDYAFQQTLDDHSSSITAVRFVRDENRLQMISCGADKSIIFRTAQFMPQLQFVRDHHVVGRTTLYDMEVDGDQRGILTACQDRHVRVYCVGSGKHARSFKGSLGEDGTLIKVVLDPSSTFAVTSCTDKNLCVFDYASGECVATVYGHSELVTGLRFTNDCKHLISVSGDGCIFIWKLPIELTHQMHVRLAQATPKLRRSLSPQRRSSAQSRSPTRRPTDGFGPAYPELFDARVHETDDGGVADYRFSVGPLPKWAKKEVADDLGSSSMSREKVMDVVQPKGRWAQRIDTQGLTVRSFYSSDHVIPYPGQAGVRSTSIDDAVRNETTIRSKTGSARESPSDFIPCADSLDEIRRGATPPSPGPYAGVSVRSNRGSSSAAATDTSHRRQRLATDSSGASSPIRGYELESTEVDGDDEESLETDHSAELDVQEVIYYPQLNDPLDSFDTEFKVCATNQDELRDSHRRFRKGRAERSDLPVASAHGSEDDDEESPTPQGMTDRSVMSMLNVSMESLDRVGQREKFLKSNYESLDGGGVDVPFTVDDADVNRDATGHASLPSNLQVNGNGNEDDRLSLSARYLNRSGHQTPSRNSTLHRSPSLNEPSSPRRLEIMKQIEQTRRKLDTIGYKASMNSSKSIGDLTDIPEKDYCGGGNKGGGGRYFSSIKDLNSNDAIRRASSMNDLSHPCRLLAPPNITVTKTTSNIPTTNHAGNTRRTNVEPSSRVRETRPRPAAATASSSTSMSRSSSMGTLNPSESDNESNSTAGTTTTLGKSIGSNLNRWERGTAMKPTISSQNKAVGIRGSQDALNGGRGAPVSFDKPPSVPWAAGGGRRIMGSNVERLRTQFDARRNGHDPSSGECSPTDTKPPPPPPSSSRSTSIGGGTLPRNHGRRASSTSLSLSSSRSRSEKDLSKVGMTVAKGKVAAAVQSYGGRNGLATTNGGSDDLEDVGLMLEKSPQELPVKDNVPQTLDVASAPLGRGLCDWTSQSLKVAADNVLQLYKRVAMDSDLLDSERIEMLNMLCESVSQAQQTIRPVNPNGVGGYLSDQLSSMSTLHQGSAIVGMGANKGGDGAESSSSATSTSSAHWKTDSDGGGGGRVSMAPSSQQQPQDHTHLLQQYSDMLLSIVQQRMGSQT